MYTGKMSSALRLLLLAIGCLACCVAQDAPSEKVLSFASMFSCLFSNGKQVQNELHDFGEPGHDEIASDLKPVDIKFLEPNVTLYLREFDDGVPVRHILIILGEDGNGNVQIRKTFFKKLVPESEFLNLTPEDLIITDDCIGQFEQAGPAVFTGTLTSCISADEKPGSRYAITLTCEKIIVTIDNTDFPENRNLLPYILNVKKRYSLLPSSLKQSPNFKPPCAQ